MFDGMSKIEIAKRLIEIAENCAETDVAKRNISFSEVHPTGYMDGPDEPVVLGDWNSHADYDGDEWTVHDDTPKRLGIILDRLGIEIDWHDEFSRCSRCFQLVRTVENGYSWKPKYKIINGGIECKDCMLEDFEWVLDQEFINNPKSAVTLDVDLTEYGFEKYNGHFETGWHSGQDDDPEKVFDKLKEEYDHVVFKLDSTGQFDSHWSVWVRNRQ